MLLRAAKITIFLTMALICVTFFAIGGDFFYVLQHIAHVELLFLTCPCSGVAVQKKAGAGRSLPLSAR